MTIESKIKGINTNQLIEMVEALINKTDEYSNMVFEFVFDELGERLPEDKFLHLCNQIEEMQA